MVDLKIIREKALSDCSPGLAFWICNGAISRNLYELVNNIRALNQWGFMYHVNLDNHKNDFSKWIADVLGDLELADHLVGILDKDRYVDIICQRIRELENAQ